MLEVGQNKNEDKNARADRISRQLVTAERRATERKTAHLRELRLAQEAIQEAAKANEPKPATKRPSRARAKAGVAKPL